MTVEAAEPTTLVSHTVTPQPTHDSVDLDEAFLMAVRRSETLQMKEEDIAQAAAKYKQILGGVLPQITFKASEMIQHTPTSDFSANPSSINSTFIRRSTPYTAFNLTQPIFAGFKEWRAMSASKAIQSRTRHEKNRAAQLLYQDVAQSFYTVLQFNNDVGILQRQRSVLASRVTELRERVSVGRSRTSEVAAAEAQLANIQAWLAETAGLQSVAWEMLEFLTGATPATTLKDPFVHEGTAALDHYLSHSETREDVLAVRSAIDEARGNLGVARAGHYPTIGASANYYPYRVGFYEPIKWDVTFSMSFPIFQGGTVNAQIQEAKSKLAASHLGEQLAVRQSEKEIRSAHATWRASLEQARAYATAATKNRANYEAQRTDYQTNLVSNLEVLQAQANWLDSERKANQLRHQSRMNYVQLLVAAGKIPTLGNE